MKHNKEIWKNIVGFNDLYSVSTTGKVQNNLRSIILSPFHDKDNYLRIKLYNNTGRVSHFVHRLVMNTFKPIENSNIYHVNHINWNPEDNNLKNLEWTLTAENMRKKMNCSKSHQTFVKLLSMYSDIELNNLLLQHLRRRGQS